MKSVSRRRIFGLFKALVPGPLTTALGVNAPYARDFPTRTVEKENSSFDPATGMIHWEEENRKEPFALIVDGLVDPGKSNLRCGRKSSGPPYQGQISAEVRPAGAKSEPGK